ncbi:MAG: hypothetical protein AAF581_21445, partial [Planctomycetota bacterium]
MALKVIGGLLIVFGGLDLIGSFAVFDVWTDWLGIALPEIIWRFSAYIELVIGFFLFRLGSKNDADESD